MAYLEELLPEFRNGAKIRRAGLPKPVNAKGYIFYKEGKIYNEFGRECEPDLGLWLSKNDWELYQDPEPDWDYIIENKCLCWFWDNCDKEDWQRARCLSDFIPNKTTPFLDEANYFWPYCRPVRRDEVTFYEDKK